MERKRQGRIYGNVEERDEAELQPLKFESYTCCWVAYLKNY